MKNLKLVKVITLVGLQEAVINLEDIDSIEPTFNGGYSIKMKSGFENYLGVTTESGNMIKSILNNMYGSIH
jgi:hypothetical protein